MGPLTNTVSSIAANGSFNDRGLALGLPKAMAPKGAAALNTPSALQRQGPPSQESWSAVRRVLNASAWAAPFDPNERQVLWNWKERGGNADSKLGIKDLQSSLNQLWAMRQPGSRLLNRMYQPCIPLPVCWFLSNGHGEDQIALRLIGPNGGAGIRTSRCWFCRCEREGSAFKGR